MPSLVPSSDYSSQQYEAAGRPLQLLYCLILIFAHHAVHFADFQKPLRSQKSLDLLLRRPSLAELLVQRLPAIAAAWQSPQAQDTGLFNWKSRHLPGMQAAASVNTGSGLWRADEGVPPWFKPERFLDQNFDADSYVADLRRYVSITSSVILPARLCIASEYL